MYPLTHIYFARKVMGFLDDALLLGSIFPDMVTLCDIPWEESHRLGLILWPHFKKAAPPLVHFTQGIITHGIEPRGLDYYSDEQYGSYEKGYCFEKAKPLIEQVVEVLRIPPENGWWKAHNFIEMGIELHIYERFPELQGKLFQAFQQQSLIDLLVSSLSPILVERNRPLKHCFSVFKQYIEKEEMDATLLAIRYERQINHRHNIESIDIAHCRDLIVKGQRLIETELEDFFEDVKIKIKPILEQMQ